MGSHILFLFREGDNHVHTAPHFIWQVIFQELPGFRMDGVERFDISSAFMVAFL